MSERFLAINNICGILLCIVSETKGTKKRRGFIVTIIPFFGSWQMDVFRKPECNFLIFLLPTISREVKESFEWVDVLLPCLSSHEIVRDSHSEPRAWACRGTFVSSSDCSVISGILFRHYFV